MALPEAFLQMAYRLPCHAKNRLFGRANRPGEPQLRQLHLIADAPMNISSYIHLAAANYFIGEKSVGISSVDLTPLVTVSEPPASSSDDFFAAIHSGSTRNSLNDAA